MNKKTLIDVALDVGRSIGSEIRQNIVPNNEGDILHEKTKMIYIYIFIWMTSEKGSARRT